MDDLLKQRFRIITDFKSKFNTPEIKEECERELTSILESDEISIHCLNLMIESISQYCIQKQKLINKLHKELLQKDLQVINDLLGSFDVVSLSKSKKRKLRFTQQFLLDKGISHCTILTGLQRLWIEKLSEHIARNVTDITTTEDYKRYGLIPGQHLFYYGAFTGTVTGIHSFATHHFVYVGKGLILEVGTDLVKGCLDVDTMPKLQPKTLIQKLLNPRSYKNLMSYFGLSTITNAVKWAEMYGQRSFYIYDYPNDKNIDVIVRRLQRGEELIGKWNYSLFLVSNNCENAANYISLGRSISSQACLSDMLSSSLQSIISKVPFMSSEQKQIVETGILSPITFEHELKYLTDIPTCDKHNSYANRYVTKKNYICEGLPTFLRDEYGAIIESSCRVDPNTCATCPKDFEDEVNPDEGSYKVCKLGKSKKGKTFEKWQFMY